MIYAAAEFCIQTEQWHNGSSISSLGLAKTLDVPNIVLEGNSQLSDGPSYGSKWLVVYMLQQSKTQAVAKPIILAGHTFLYKTGFCRNFAMTCPETSDTKDVANELNFLLVTHMTCFDIWFDNYRLLKSGFSTRQILDSLGIQMLAQHFELQDG
jgi:hypothetical protein